MSFAARLVPLAALLLVEALPARAASGDPCAAGRAASPLARDGGRLVVTHDIAAFVARHAEIACARLETLLRDAAPGDGKATARVRVVQGEFETGVLEPLFRLHPYLRGRDLTAADAPGVAVKLGPFGSPPRPRQMGLATAQHLRWVSSDAERRFFDLFKTFEAKPALAKVPADDAAKTRAAAAMSGLEDVSTEIGFVGAPAQRNYPALWKVEQRELETRMPKQTRTAKSDAAFRDAAPPPGSVKLTAAAAAQMRAFIAGLKRESRGCHVLAISWTLKTRWRGPDDASWHESGPEVGIGAWSCAEVPPDVIRTIDGLQVVFGGDKADRFAGKMLNYADKHFMLKGN